MTNYYSPIAIIETDLTGHILMANESAIHLFNLPIKTCDESTKRSSIFDFIEPLKNHSINTLEKLDSQLIIVKQQTYLLQVTKETNKYLFIIQPSAYLKHELNPNRIINQQAFDVFCAKSTAMQKLIKQAKAFSNQVEPLLISGATGTGKDLLALACHQYSARGDKVFLALNCAAMPDEVVESELYGHAPGAFPGGAMEAKKGFFEQANGGSVLLDGIDEMSFRMQTKLLRFINDGSFRRVGDDNEVHVDVRVICATKADLRSLMEQGKFREDLYYRLNVLSLNIPALKDRKEDIPGLAEFFIQEFANKQGRKPVKIDEKAINALQNYSWAGNVRELKNILYSALAQLNGEELTVADISLPTDTSAPTFVYDENMANQSLDEMVKQFEKQVLNHLYQDFPSSRKLSKRLGISHTAIANKLRDYGIGK
ncbi:sigma 54-interacting transcriptional regulator [Orbaceae bacterium ac157xtp]